MRLFGLIGYPLSHSFSGKFFAEKFLREGIKDALYELYPIQKIEELPLLIQQKKELIGLNVTIPFKQQVLYLLDQTEEVGREIGAINTIKILRNRDNPVLIGYNTDVFGFEASLLPLLSGDYLNSKALILGTGGASLAVERVLRKLGFEMAFVSRTPRKPSHISYQSITKEIIASSRLIVNTSPKGMTPHADECPDIPYQYLNRNHILYDLIYNPEETLFLRKGREQGAVTKNGLQMLHLQAERSWEIWNEF